MIVNCETLKGGSVNFNEEHHCWASYAVATVGSVAPPEILYAGLTLPDGRAVQFFCNRESGLVVVEVIDKNGKGGTELLRKVL